MTEKRYGMSNETGAFIDKQINKEYTDDEIIDLLNELHEENIKLNNFKKKAFELINKKIKHYQHEPISAPVMQPLSKNFDYDVDRLARLSELQQLLKELEE